MAKSIYEVLNDLITETSVPKVTDSKGIVIRESFGDVKHTIPRDLLPTAEQFENENQLVDWATDNNCLHALMQKGIQKFLIEIRATFKGMKKGDTWTKTYGQDNVDAMEWKITNRPNQGGSKSLDKENYNKCTQMIAKLSGKGMDKETVIDLTSDVYGLDIVESIFKELELLKG